MKPSLRIALLTVLAVSATAVFGCAPQQAESVDSERPPAESGSAGNASESDPSAIPSAGIEWSTDVDCTLCHQKEATSFDDAAAIASAHAQFEESCLTCHDDESGLVAAHENASDSGKPPSRLKKTEVRQEVCLTCHDVDELAAATADSALLTDSEGTTANPHRLPENDDHALLGCESCHKMHSTETVEKTAQKACTDCHHSGVYQCYTCHE